MFIAKIGTKLYGEFVGNKGFRKVVVDTLGNKTTTTIYDKEGNVIKNRIKTLAKEQVGNKSVYTKTTEDAAGKNITSRVYNQQGDLLGGRMSNYYPNSETPHHTIKWNKDWSSSTQIVNGVEGYNNTRYSKNFGKGGYFGAIGRHRKPLYYNAKGIPIPPALGKNVSNVNSTLSEMRDKIWREITENNLPREVYDNKTPWSLKSMSEMAEQIKDRLRIKPLAELEKPDYVYSTKSFLPENHLNF